MMLVAKGLGVSFFELQSRLEEEDLPNHIVEAAAIIGAVYAPNEIPESIVERPQNDRLQQVALNFFDMDELAKLKELTRVHDGR